MAARARLKNEFLRRTKSVMISWDGSFLFLSEVGRGVAVVGLIGEMHFPVFLLWGPARKILKTKNAEEAIWAILQYN